MSRVRLCRTAKEVANQLLAESGESKVASVVVIPPEPDALTDEEDLDDNATGAPTIRGDCAGTYEIVIENQNEDDFEVEDINLPLKKARQSAKEKPNWKHDTVEQPSLKKSDFKTKEVYQSLEPYLRDSISSPVKLFESFFDTDVFDLITLESNRYAKQKNMHNVEFCSNDYRLFVGFLIFTGYHTLPQQKLYWSQREDFGVEFVKTCISRDYFLKLKQVLHLVNNDTVCENQRKDFKVASLYDLLNKKFLRFGIHDEHLCVDEQMVKYFGHNSLKQFLRNKPTRFGLKNWCINGSTGYCYNLKLYCGKEHADSLTNSNLCLGSRVVLDLINKIGVTESNVITMDNFFCSHELLCILKERGIPACGTIRPNRTAGAPLSDDAELKRKGRGAYDAVFDAKNEIECVKWYDNRCVTLAANFEHDRSEANVKRYVKKSGKVDVPQPGLVALYNQTMGGVDSMDAFVNQYRIAITGKKWYWCLITNLIDVTVSNAWIIYRKLHNEGRANMTLLEFKSEIALYYMKTYATRSGFSNGRVSAPPSSLRFDGEGHFLATRSSQRRCQGPQCKKKPVSFCKKCDITLCKQCFPVYHANTL